MHNPASLRLRCAMLMLASTLAVCACQRSDPETKLRATISAMQAAAEAREPRAFVEHVSEDFIGTPGNQDRDGLRNVLRGVLLSQQSVGVTLGPIDLKLYGEGRARVSTTVLVSGDGGMLAGNSDSLTIQSDWRVEDGEWRCIAATWE